jgi:hypothetical protein
VYRSDNLVIIIIIIIIIIITILACCQGTHQVGRGLGGGLHEEVGEEGLVPREGQQAVRQVQVQRLERVQLHLPSKRALQS